MSTPFRNLIVTATALLLILGPIGWAMQFRRNFQAKYAKQARDFHVAQGNPAAAIMSDAELLKDFGMEVTGEEMTGLLWSDLLLKFWWFWSLFVVAVCYGLFVMLGYMLPPSRHAGLPMSAPPSTHS